MTKKFYSNGKLLLTGEYAILDGAEGFAVPTKYGQSLEITKIKSHKIVWKSFDENSNLWFDVQFEGRALEITSKTDRKVAETLQKILLEAQKLNPNFLSNTVGYKINTYLDFPRDWGLGSSSTLINNIAQWANVDSFSLLWNAFAGSGYDIACAMHNTPILYQLIHKTPVVTSVEFNPVFLNDIYFIYLNKKQDSREGITAYRKASFNTTSFISKITSLTKQMYLCNDVTEFKKLVLEHENVIGEAISQTPVQKNIFNDFNGAIKSLGAWGGDFIMAVGEKNTSDYFKSKGYTTVIPYAEMVLSSSITSEK